MNRVPHRLLLLGIDEAGFGPRVGPLCVEAALVLLAKYFIGGSGGDADLPSVTMNLPSSALSEHLV